MDRCIAIHQALDNPHYTFEQKLLAKQQLAKVLWRWVFDRAEHLYILMVDGPRFAEAALQQLAIILSKTKEWKKPLTLLKSLQNLS